MSNNHFGLILVFILNIKFDPRSIPYNSMIEWSIQSEKLSELLSYYRIFPFFTQLEPLSVSANLIKRVIFYQMYFISTYDIGFNIRLVSTKYMYVSHVY